MSEAATPAPLLIWGAGAVGGTVGAYLARAGQDVLLVDAAEDHVAAMGNGGLAVEGPIDTFRAPVRAVTPDALSGRFTTVLLCVKAQHTEAAARRMLPCLADDGCVVSLQNGLNELTLAAIVGRQRVMGAFINFGADYLAPGRILYGGRGAVVVGELDGRTSERLGRVHRLLRLFEPEATATDDIWGYLWGKLGYGALLFATALTDAAIADVLDARRYRPVLTALAREVATLAAARGVTPRGFNGYDPAAFGPAGTAEEVDRSMQAMVRHNRGSAKSHSGIWRDLAVRRRKTEVDAQLAILLPLAAEAGVAMPLTARLVALVHDIEEGRRPLAWETLDALAAASARAA